MLNNNSPSFKIVKSLFRLARRQGRSVKAQGNRRASTRYTQDDDLCYEIRYTNIVYNLRTTEGCLPSHLRCGFVEIRMRKGVRGGAVVFCMTPSEMTRFLIAELMVTIENGSVLLVSSVFGGSCDSAWKKTKVKESWEVRVEIEHYRANHRRHWP